MRKSRNTRSPDSALASHSSNCLIARMVRQGVRGFSFTEPVYSAPLGLTGYYKDFNWLAQVSYYVLFLCGEFFVKTGVLGWLFVLWVVFLSGTVMALADSSETGEPDMVLIPAGDFLLGSAEGTGRKDEYPQHTVYLDAYWIDRYEVTGGDFEAYLAQNPKQHPTITGWYDRKVRPGMERKPVIGLTWKRCRNYCLWRGKRLPTEAEWERAAGGRNHRTYPWGEELPDETRAHFNRCCFIDKGDTLQEVGALELGKTPRRRV